jgi:hypothetical protein
MQLTTDEVATDWLTLPQGEWGIPAYPGGFERHIWVLHAMYENPNLRADITWDDLKRWPELAEFGPSEDELSGADGWDRDWPRPGWIRLPWSTLGQRVGVDPFAGRIEARSFALDDADPWEFRSWPINLGSPSTGSLDRAQYLQLVRHLGSTPERAGAVCFALYDVLAAIRFTEDRELNTPLPLYRGRVSDLAALADSPDLEGSPTFIWPTDRSWLVYTDYDRMATLISGSASLIGQLDADSSTETVLQPATTR